MPRRTKIVATLGPATDEPTTLEQMLRAGVDVVRLNFSHGSEEEHLERVRMVREISQRIGRDVGVLGDLQGPKIRIGRFRDGSVELTEGKLFHLDISPDAGPGDSEGVSVTYPALVDDVKAGDVLLLDDGQLALQVEAVKPPRVQCRVTVGGKLSDNKGINLQGGGLSAKALTDKDRRDIQVAAHMEIDYLAVSFPRDAADIEEARRLLRAAGGHGYIVAKIERAEALNNIDEMIDASDVIMVARGDLGVEIGYAELPWAQKRIIRATRDRNRAVITATQMMESMIEQRSPTRAEVSDVANAVLDGTDAVMLSGETAVGKYPVRVVEAMAKVCEGAEQAPATRRSQHRIDDRFDRVDEAIAMAAMYTANHLDVKAIVALTESGSTALWMSRIRSGIPIFALTRHEATRRRVTIYRGVYPVAFDVVHTAPTRVFYKLSQLMLRRGAVQPGDLVIYTEGDLSGVQGGTNSLRIMQVGEPG